MVDLLNRFNVVLLNLEGFGKKFSELVINKYFECFL